MIYSFPYFAMFIPIAIAAYFNLKIAFPWLTALLILFSCFRYGVGYDYHAYVDIINHVNQIELEPLSELIINISRHFQNEQLFFTISSLIITLPIFYLFVNKTANPNLALLIFFTFPYFFLSSLTIVRQWMAISVFMFGFSFLYKRNVFTNLLVILTSFFLHYSAVIVIPLVLFRKILIRPLSWYTYIFLLILPLLYLAFAKEIHNLIINIAPKYAAYINSGDNGINILIFYSVLIVIFMLFMIRINHPVQWLYVNASAIGLSMLTLLSTISEASMRASYYYLIFLIPALVNSIETMISTQRYRMIVIIIGFIVLLIQLYLGFINKNANPYFPVNFRISS